MSAGGRGDGARARASDPALAGGGSGRPPNGAEGDAERSPRHRPGLTPVSLLLTLLVAYILYQVQFVVVLVLMALVFATLIEHPVQLLERARLPRPLAILLVYALTIGGVLLLFVLLAPVIRGQVAIFRVEAPVQFAQLQQSWQESPNALLQGPGQEMLGRAIALIKDPQLASLPVPQDAAVDMLAGVGGGLVGILTTLVIAFYYLMEKAWLRQELLGHLPPRDRLRIGRALDEVEAKVGGWLRGQLLLCLVIGSLATVGYGVMGVRFWPLLGLWAGITEIVPILGPWLGGIPAVLIAMTQSWDKALMVAGWAILIQFLENTTLVPRVMKGAVGLSPLTVFLAILAGTQFLGIAGAILAIPVAAAVQVVVDRALDARREARRGEAAPSGWRWMRGPTPPQPVPEVPDDAPSGWTERVERAAARPEE